MKFKEFLLAEEEVRNLSKEIKIIISQLSAEDLNDFGIWLYDEIFDEDGDGVDDEGYSVYDMEDTFDTEEIYEIIDNLDPEDLEYVLYMLEEPGEEDDEEDFDDTNDTDNLEDSDEDPEDLDERVSARFKVKSRNRKKNKRFTLSKAKFRAGKAARKKAARLNRAKRRMNYRKNRIKIKKYGSSYRNTVKAGKHIKKIRR